MNTIECNVIELPSKSSNICYVNIDGERIWNVQPNRDAFIPAEKLTPIDLYFTSDEEVREGDWVISKNKVVFKSKVNGLPRSYYWKIIASTDPSLGLPGIPDSFVRRYIDADSKIEKVELLKEIDLNNPPEGYHLHTPSGKYHDDEPHLMKSLTTNPDREPNYKLKLTANNEVIVLNTNSLDDKDETARQFIAEHGLPDDMRRAADAFAKIMVPDLCDEFVEAFSENSNASEDEELEDAAFNYSLMHLMSPFSPLDFKAGANWQKERLSENMILFAAWCIDEEWKRYIYPDNRGRWFKNNDFTHSISDKELYKLWQQKNSSKKSES